jgi:hypothetical protein
VFANKAVFAIYGFPYPVLLTWIHILFTAVGMHIMAAVRRASSWPPCDERSQQRPTHWAHAPACIASSRIDWARLV